MTPGVNFGLGASGYALRARAAGCGKTDAAGPGLIPIPSLQGLGPIWFFGVPTLLALVCLGLDGRRRERANKVLLVAIVLLVASFVTRLAIMTTDASRVFATWMVGVV